MKGLTVINVISCEICHVLGFTTTATSRAIEIPGTHGSNECRQTGMHVRGFEVLGTVQAGRICHIALSTMIRRETSPQDLRDVAHISQAWLAVGAPDRRIGIPSRLLDGYGVSSEGWALARHVSRHMSIIAGTSETARWLMITALLRTER